MITGMLNEHPRVAISYRDSQEKDNFVKFYDMLTTPEPEDVIKNPR
jgi:4-hydroxy 2-oxovalerate aldolase